LAKRTQDSGQHKHKNVRLPSSNIRSFFTLCWENPKLPACVDSMKTQKELGLSNNGPRGGHRGDLERTLNSR